jgi:hypothetical protein
VQAGGLARRAPCRQWRKAAGAREIRFEGAFATDGVAKKHGDKVDHFIVPETATGKADALCKGVKDSKLLQITDDEDGLLEYVIMPPFLIVWHGGLDIAARRSVVFHPLPSQRSSTACFCPGALR